MEMKNCAVCGRMFVYYGNKVCRECLEDYEQSFFKVRDYLYSNPDADISTLCEKTGVEEKMILQMLREGRLELKEESSSLTCRACGKIITTGNYCTDCFSSIKRSMEKVINKGTNANAGNDGNKARHSKGKLYHVDGRLLKSNKQ